ncbi:MAG: hypothetical protein AAGK37_19255 [Pseudomonadota bacterium]
MPRPRFPNPDTRAKSTAERALAAREQYLNTINKDPEMSDPKPITLRIDLRYPIAVMVFFLPAAAGAALFGVFGVELDNMGRGMLATITGLIGAGFSFIYFFETIDSPIWITWPPRETNKTDKKPGP